MFFLRKTSQKPEGFFLLLTLFIFFSCKTIPVKSSPDEPVSFSAVGSIKPEWQPFADGIDFFHGKILMPQMEFWALQIDLASPNTQIVVRSGAANETRPSGGTSGTFGTKVSSFVRDNNLAAGINAVPFDVVTSREGQPIINAGVVISRGVLLAPVNRRYDALVFFKDGRAAIVRQSSILSIEEIDNAIGGFHQILAGGEAAERTQEREDRHPRSAAGISADGRYLYLLVIDGRRSGSIGGTENETALILESLGAWDGINFDGGGSSALVLRYPDGQVRAVNVPVHGGIPGTERAVAGCIGVYLRHK
ncbi:MAG: phosphodiester glycosidase family protein [Treponema sp.]|jgi:hypothetical protein|nr:phosphodiester glycosidase family protein [Treponema sp.]